MISNNSTKNIDNLVLNFLKGHISSEEKIQLEKWLASDEENRATFKRLYSLWKTISIQSVDNFEVQQAFERVQLHTFKKEVPQVSLQKHPSRIYMSSRKWAAIFIGIVVLIPLITYFFHNVGFAESKLQATNVISVPLGSKSKIILPDGTEVWLNAGSKLTYNMNYGASAREVNLTGEGYFKVTKNKNKPFIVHTVKANIKALGTEFNVKAYPDEPFIETILVKGSVAVNQINTLNNNYSKNGSEGTLILKPGQKARIFKVVETVETKVQIAKAEQEIKPVAILAIQPKNDEITLQEANTAIETSWKDERWIIKAENLNVLAVLLARRFNVSIALTSEALLKYKFSGTIQNETLEQVFKIMSLTIPISYNIDKGNVTLSFNNRFEERYKAAYTK
jgi:transmembrane sensor